MVRSVAVSGRTPVACSRWSSVDCADSRFKGADPWVHCVGCTKNELPYTSEDRLLLSTIADSAGMVLDGGLADEVRLREYWWRISRRPFVRGVAFFFPKHTPPARTVRVLSAQQTSPISFSKSSGWKENSAQAEWVWSIVRRISLLNVPLPSRPCRPYRRNTPYNSEEKRVPWPP